jgi:hypothetical protein
MALRVIAELHDLASPVMSAAAGFYPDKAGRLLREDAKHLATSQPTVDYRRAITIRTMNLENMLGQILPDGANLLHGTIPSIVAFEQRPRFCAMMLLARAVPSHCMGARRPG